MHAERRPDTEFIEVQQFRQPWIWILLLAITLGITVMYVHGIYTQLYLGYPWGDRPMSDTALIMSATLSLVLTGGIALLFYKLRLITTVDREGVLIRFYPFTRKHIAFDNINACEARTYRPIKEYGGWGIRFSRKGRAYNVSGNRGVQLQLTEGRPVLIGSQNAERLAEVINRHIQS